MQSVTRRAARTNILTANRHWRGAVAEKGGDIGDVDLTPDRSLGKRRAGTDLSYCSSACHMVAISGEKRTSPPKKRVSHHFDLRPVGEAEFGFWLAGVEAAAEAECGARAELDVGVAELGETGEAGAAWGDVGEGFGALAF